MACQCPHDREQRLHCREDKVRWSHAKQLTEDRWHLWQLLFLLCRFVHHVLLHLRVRDKLLLVVAIVLEEEIEVFGQCAHCVRLADALALAETHGIVIGEAGQDGENLTGIVLANVAKILYK